MKTPDHKFRKIIIVLAVNTIISWVIGNVYKDDLIGILSTQVYYQLIVLISLMIAPIVTTLYANYIDFILKIREKKISARIDERVLNELNGEDKIYAESLINPNIVVSEQIKSLRAERAAFEKSS